MKTAVAVLFALFVTFSSPTAVAEESQDPKCHVAAVGVLNACINAARETIKPNEETIKTLAVATCTQAALWAEKTCNNPKSLAKYQGAAQCPSVSSFVHDAILAGGGQVALKIPKEFRPAFMECVDEWAIMAAISTMNECAEQKRQDQNKQDAEHFNELYKKGTIELKVETTVLYIVRSITVALPSV